MGVERSPSPQSVILHTNLFVARLHHRRQCDLLLAPFRHLALISINKGKVKNFLWILGDYFSFLVKLIEKEQFQSITCWFPVAKQWKVALFTMIILFFWMLEQDMNGLKRNDCVLQWYFSPIVLLNAIFIRCQETTYCNDKLVCFCAAEYPLFRKYGVTILLPCLKTQL